MVSVTHCVDFDEKRIDSVCADLDRCHLPGAAVGIAIRGTPVYRKGFGLASMELPVSLSPTIRMRIASITKHFAALAYLLLCEEGRAGIDDPIGKYLPELHPVARQVTVRQLMGHIGGLRDAYDLLYHFSGTGARVCSDEVLSLYRAGDDVNTAPGVTWSYSSGGYVMLTAAIERIASRSLEDVLRERIFAPVGLHDTLLRRWDTDFVPNSATLHATTPTGGYDRSYLGSALAGEGGMVSTVDDMLRWLAHMDAPIVGSAGTWQTLKTPLKLANGTSTGYGLGLMSGRYRGFETLFHPGGVSGGNAQMLKVPAASLDIIVMLNRHDVLGMTLAERILDVCLPALAPLADGPGRPIATGTFQSPATGRVIQLLDKEEQQIVSLEGFDMPVVADQQGVLRPSGAFGYLKHTVMLRGDPEKPSAIRFSDFGNPDELVRVEPVGGSDVREIAGRYRSVATGTEATFPCSQDGPQLHTVGPFGSATYALECIAAGLWRATSPMPRSAILSFDQDAASFRFSSWLTRALPFRRVA
jgi:CubicO group peptidase (beta-lactamase class C family)